jgi:transposase
VRQARAHRYSRHCTSWLIATVRQLSKKSDLAWRDPLRALRAGEALTALSRDDGRIEIDNNAAERALRAVALRPQKLSYLPAPTAGGERAAAIYSLIGTAKLNGLDPEAYLRRRAYPHRRAPDQPHRGVASVERASAPPPQRLTSLAA